jgi:hypothetical protein
VGAGVVQPLGEGPEDERGVRDDDERPDRELGGEPLRDLAQCAQRALRVLQAATRDELAEWPADPAGEPLVGDPGGAFDVGVVGRRQG